MKIKQWTEQNGVRKTVVIQFNVILNDNYTGLEYTSFQMHENIWTFDIFCPEQ